jgi:hypothetical protein
VEAQKYELLSAQRDELVARLAEVEHAIEQVCPRLKIVSVMSIPRVGWNDHWGCHWRALKSLNLYDQKIGFGAWWEHSLSNLMEDSIDEGADWLLTMDYDTMFTAEHVSRLFQRLGENSHMDCVAAMQPKRGASGAVLMTPESGVNEFQMNGEAIKAVTAHFGLTVFRVESLQKMSKPWFLHEPNNEGSYRNNDRIDPDMYFWRKWRDTGNTLYVDPTVMVGHLEVRVAELVLDGTKLVTEFADVMEWRKNTNRQKVTRSEAA